jgi:uncharacterized protein involved in response to NO
MTTIEDFFVTTLQESFFNLCLFLFIGIVVFADVWISLIKVWRWRRIQPRSKRKVLFYYHANLFSIGSILLAGVYAYAYKNQKGLIGNGFVHLVR